MSDIGPGDWVECASLQCGCEGVRPLALGWFLTVGSTYRVTWTGRCADGTASIAVAQWPAKVFCLGHFRPIYRPRESLIRGLLEPARRETVEALGFIPAG